MLPSHLKEYVIEPTLDYLELKSDAAVNLLLGTASQESNLGRYIKQIKGPALGIYQMEPATHQDIWDNYLKYKPELADKVRSLSSKNKATTELITNLAYATAMARIHYLRVREALPEADDIKGLARYWKKYYNTELGKGTDEEFVHNYLRFINDMSMTT